MAERPRTHRQRLCSWCFKTFTKDEHLARHSPVRVVAYHYDEFDSDWALSDSLLRHSRCHRSSGAIPPTSAAHSTENDAIHPPLNRHDEQVSPFNHDYSIGSHEPHTSPDHLSSFGSRYPNANPGSASHSLANPAKHRTAVGSNVEESGQSNNDGGVAGLPTPGSQSQLTGLGPSLHDSGQDGSWVFGSSNTQIPAWFADDDFDLGALNLEILMSTDNWVPPGNSGQYQNEPEDDTSRSLVEDTLPSQEQLVQTHWYTFMGTSRTGHTTPDTGPEPTQVDEAYRASLAAKLQPHMPFLPLPSTDFLNICIQMYFTKFHPVFPIVHAPTFRPSAKSSLLLLSICSIGSLFVGSSHAASKGVKVFETLNKTILSSWEIYFSRQGPETIAMIQAALIGQTFGLLSGRQKDLLIEQTFHGTLVVWAKRATPSKLKRASEYINLSEVLHTPEKAWKKWVQAEEQNRLLAGIHVHDVEISELFLTDTYLRHSPEKLPPLSDDDLWAATTVEDWSGKIMTRLSDSNMHEIHPRPPDTIADHAPLQLTPLSSNGFHAYLELEGLGKSAVESKNTNSPAQRQYCEDRLIVFYKTHISPNTGHTRDPYSLPVLWHSIFLSLYANTDRLELVIGKEGYIESENHVSYAQSWASSPDGQRCALHAAIILRKLEQEKISTEPPIHIPRIIFRAALVWFCYTRFGSDTASSQQNMEFPELQKIGLDYQRLLFEANGFKTSRPTTAESSTFCGLVDILSRAGHWGISQLFASILDLLLPDVKDDERYARRWGYPRQ
ncbi:hypothetical protein PENFLA_c029G10970 [Penicillium flavigenum]|uniref:Xylanolytic transcriptional activator regulatory domain-containing protein n=1 Tax=Penicillium flavigenum TaxID=254877 RepID=A0A1V6SQ16_9EURO|nr:hypothetical protein PENFLA_c029G10970 [Penicillium flavigenum]